jgi:RES domain-containing protein
MTAMREASQGLPFKIEPYLMCSYDVDCTDIVDLRTDSSRTASGIAHTDLACAWFADAKAGNQPASWLIAQRLITQGHAGALVPSFAPGATDDDHNPVLWTWGPDPPHRVTVFDPSGRLPKNQLSWT